MARNRNPGTRVGRPPKLRSTVAAPMMPGQPPGPMDNFDSATPGAAFKRGGGVGGFKPMPKYHPDKGFCGGGKTK